MIFEHSPKEYDNLILLCRFIMKHLHVTHTLQFLYFLQKREKKEFKEITNVETVLSIFDIAFLDLCNYRFIQDIFSCSQSLNGGLFTLIDIF